MAAACAPPRRNDGISNGAEPAAESTSSLRFRLKLISAKVGLPVSVGPVLPESQADRPAFCHRTRRSPTARYTKRRCQGSFGSFLGSGRGRADDDRVRYVAARVRL